MARTPAIAAAERAGVAFTHEYQSDPGAPSYGLEAAGELGVDPVRVFKTLVVEIDGKPLVAIVSGEADLDLRALGKRGGCRALEIRNVSQGDSCHNGGGAPDRRARS